MADIQLEHGYTRIANEILEHMARVKLSPTQYRILFTVWRFTYGFKRKDHEFSLTFLSNATGIHKQRIKPDLDKLIEKKILVVTEENTYSKSRKIAFNKNFDTWVNEESAKPLTVSNSADTPVSNSADSTVSNSAYQERKYLKKNIKKDIAEEDNLLNRILELLEKSEILGEKGITEFLRDDISDIIDNFGFDDSERMIEEAIKDSARGNGRTWKYVYKKLVAWKKQGIKSIADLENLNDPVPQKQPRTGKYGKPIRQEHVPDWFDEENPYQNTPAKPEPVDEAKKQAIMDKLKQFQGK